MCAVENSRVLDSARLHTDEDIIDWLKPHVTGPCVMAIDAPLIVRNPTGRRECERAISRCFGRHHAGAHSSNLGLSSFRGGVRAERVARALGLDVDPEFPPRMAVRRAIEVYPHPALVALFGLERIVTYKAKRGRGTDLRRAAFLSLIRYMESLRYGDPTLDVTTAPRWSALRSGIAEASSGAALDRVEDELDAFLCAYIAVYYWTHGTSRIVGDVQSGYIVTPVTTELAQCLDAGTSAPEHT